MTRALRSQTERRLKSGSVNVLRDYLAGFQEAVLRVDLALIRENWKLFLDRGREVLIERVKGELAARRLSPAREELAISCVELAHEAMAASFERTGTYEFLSAEGFIATLRLHADLALIERLEIYEPWDLGQPIRLKTPRFQVTAEPPSEPVGCS